MNNNIALWGPSGSGKTWLVQAFAHKVSTLNRKIFRKVGMYELLLKGGGNAEEKIDISKGPTSGATNDIDQSSIYFFRKATATVDTEQFRYQVSSHIHKIDIVDNQGAATTGEMARLQDDNRHTEAAKQLLQESDQIIAILDTGKAADSAEERSDSQQLLEDLQALRKVLRGRARRIAICLTKADTLGKNIGNASFEALLKRRFPPTVAEELIHEISKMSHEDGHIVKSFVVSSAGYYIPIGQKEKAPNWVVEEGILADVDNWDPWGVEEPFFWLFENMERERLEKASHDGSGGYYRLFPVATIRAKQYMSYDEMLRLAKIRKRQGTM